MIVVSCPPWIVAVLEDPHRLVLKLPVLPERTGGIDKLLLLAVMLP